MTPTPVNAPTGGAVSPFMNPSWHQLGALAAEEDAKRGALAASRDEVETRLAPVVRLGKGGPDAHEAAVRGYTDACFALTPQVAS